MSPSPVEHVRHLDRVELRRDVSEAHDVAKEDCDTILVLRLDLLSGYNLVGDVPGEDVD